MVRLLSDRGKMVDRIIRPWVVSVAGLAALFFGLAAGEWHQISKHRVAAFATYYAAAESMRAGHSPYVRLHAYSYVYPPLFAYVCEPLTRLPIGVAARIMLGAVMAAILISLLVGARDVLRRFGLATTADCVFPLMLGAAALASFAIHKELRSLQTNAFLLLGFTLALHWIDRRPVLASLALALAISIKFLPLIALPYLLLRRRWNMVGLTIAWCAGLAMIPAIALGWTTNLHYLAMAGGGLVRSAGISQATDSSDVHELADPINISIPSTFARIAASEGWPKAAASAMALAVFIAWIAAAAWIYRRKGMPLLRWPESSGQNEHPFRELLALEWAGVLTAAVVFGPHMELVLAVFPVLLLALNLVFPAQRASRLPVIIGAVLMLAALLLPISQMGHPLTIRWNLAAAPCWFLLAAYIAIYAATVARLPPMPAAGT